MIFKDLKTLEFRPWSLNVVLTVESNKSFSGIKFVLFILTASPSGKCLWIKTTLKFLEFSTQIEVFKSSSVQYRS